MLPTGKKSLFEIYTLADPADRLINAATLLEFTLALLDPAARGAAPSLSERVRALGDQLPGGPGLLWALPIRNRVVHALGAPVSAADIESATRLLLQAVVALLPRLPPAAAQAIRGAPAASPPPAASVTFRGLNFDLHSRGPAGQWSLTLLVSFTAHGLRGQTGAVRIRFFDSLGGPLRDRDHDHDYGTESGDVAVALPFTPAADRQDFNGLTLFMPYAQLHLAQGRHTLHCWAEAYLLHSQPAVRLGESATEPFTVTRTGDDHTGGVA